MSTLRFMRPAALAAALLFNLPLAAQAADAGGSAPWNQAFQLSSAGGLVNPGVLVGFNPQPEPPARQSELVFDASANPVLVLRDQHNPPGALQLFDVFVSAGVPGQTLSFSDPTVDASTPAPMTVSTSARSPGGDVLLTFHFDIFSSSGGLLAPGTLVAFNPQPEPPAGLNSGVFGMSFAIASLSDAMVRLRMSEGAGTPLVLSAVPEPAPAGLLAAGLLVLMAQGWRRRPVRGTRPGRG